MKFWDVILLNNDRLVCSSCCTSLENAKEYAERILKSFTELRNDNGCVYQVHICEVELDEQTLL